MPRREVGGPHGPVTAVSVRVSRLPSRGTGGPRPLPSPRHHPSGLACPGHSACPSHPAYFPQVSYVDPPPRGREHLSSSPLCGRTPSCCVDRLSAAGPSPAEGHCLHLGLLQGLRGRRPAGFRVDECFRRPGSSPRSGRASSPASLGYSLAGRPPTGPTAACSWTAGPRLGLPAWPRPVPFG